VILTGRRHFPALTVASLYLLLACRRPATVSAKHPAALIEPRGLWYWGSIKGDTVNLVVGDSVWIDIFWTTASSDALINSEPPGKPVQPQWSSENLAVARVRAWNVAEACKQGPDGLECIGWPPSWRAVVVGRRPGIARIRVRVRDTTLLRPIRVTAP
jgi:hypothetical protein